jgi:hypothetical protein
VDVLTRVYPIAYSASAAGDVGVVVQVVQLTPASMKKGGALPADPDEAIIST